MNDNVVKNCKLIVMFSHFTKVFLFKFYNVNHPQEDLAKFGYMLDVNIKIFKNTYIFHLCIKISCRNMVIF